MIHEIKWFLQMLGSRGFLEYSDKIMCNCPYAPYTHSGGVDQSPSFGFRTTAKGNYRFMCFACGETGDLKKLFWDMHRHGRISGEMFKPMNNIAYFRENNSIGTIREYSPFEGHREKIEYTEEEKEIQRRYLIGGQYRGHSEVVNQWLTSETITVKDIEILPESTFEKFWSAPIPEYFLERGYDERVFRAWKLGYNETDRRIMFPCYDSLGQMVGYTGRTVWSEEYCFKCGSEYLFEEKDGKRKYNPRCPGCGRLNVKYKHHHGEWRRFSLYGMHLYVPRTPVILVEGSFDAIRLWSLGIRSPMAIFGSKPNVTQFDWIKKNGIKKVYSCGDGDSAGREMNKSIISICKQLEIPVDVILLPDNLDPGEMTRKDVASLFPEECFSG